MLQSLTSAQKLVIALITAAFVLGLWYFTGGGRDAAGTESGSEVTYTLTEAAEVPITVHVVGAVRQPGLYTLPTGSRVSHAIERAGGFSDRARADSVNLAAYLEDGQQVRVETALEPAAATVTAPAAAEPVAVTPQPTAPPSQQATGGTRRTASPSVAPSNASGSDLPSFARTPASPPVRLNSAGLEELQRIDGIGPELAKNILYYRSVNGPFRGFNDLDEVPGIGPATIEKIRVSATLN